MDKLPLKLQEDMKFNINEKIMSKFHVIIRNFSKEVQDACCSIINEEYLFPN